MKKLFLFLILFYYSFNNSIEHKDNIVLRKLQGPREPFDDRREEDFEKEEQKLISDYEDKIKENEDLKKKIEENIKYIKILLTTAVLMLSIIIFIIVRIYFKLKKRKSYELEAQKAIYKNAGIKNSNSNLYSNNNNSQNRILSTSNFSIEKSNYNLLNSDKNISVSTNSISNSKGNNELSNNSFIPEENENNFDAPNAPKIEDYSNIVINDDNKTLTNNPDVFIQSKMDKILYKPYPIEEIK
jgi:hypothetical protein